MHHCCFAVLLFCCFAVLLFCCFAVLLFCCFAVLRFCKIADFHFLSFVSCLPNWWKWGASERENFADMAIILAIQTFPRLFGIDCSC